MSDDMKQALDAASKATKRPRISKITPPTPVSGLHGNAAKDIAPKEAERAAAVKPIKDELSSDVAYRLAFIGSGQGGGNIAAAFWGLGYRRVGIINTTDKDFELIERQYVDLPRLSFNIGGAAKDMEMARAQFAGRTEEIWDLMTRSWGPDPQYVLICVGLGGGTGSGTAKGLVELARKYMQSKGLPPKVGVIASLPRAMEGQKICRNAAKAFEELMSLRVSPFILIDNDRVNAIYGVGFGRLHGKANEVTSVLLHIFNQLAAERSELVTFDQSELGQLLDGGIVTMAAGDIAEAKSPADISSVIRERLTNSVLAACDISKGHKAGCLFIAPEETINHLSTDYFDAGFSQLDRMVGSGYSDPGEEPPTVHRGVYFGEDPGIQCYVMISGLEPPYERIAELSRVGGLDAKRVVSSVASYLGVDDAT